MSQRKELVTTITPFEEWFVPEFSPGHSTLLRIEKTAEGKVRIL